MGILGSVKLVKRTRQVMIGLTDQGEPFTVKVSAPPLQLSDQIAQQIPEPKPPPLMNDKGKPRLQTNPRTGEPIKDGNGRLVPMVDENDEQYLAELENVGVARMTAMIFACTQFPGESAVVQNGSSPVGYQLARWKELEEAGCDTGAYRALTKAVTALSQPMTKDEIEEARIVLGTDKGTSEAVKTAMRDKGKKPPEGKSE